MDTDNHHNGGGRGTDSLDGMMSMILTQSLMGGNGGKSASIADTTRVVFMSYMMRRGPTMIAQLCTHLCRAGSDVGSAAYANFKKLVVRKVVMPVLPLTSGQSATDAEVVAKHKPSALVVTEDAAVAAIVWHLCTKCRMDKILWDNSGKMPASVTDFPISQGISCSMKTADVKYNDERGTEQTRTVRTITLETTRDGYDMDSLSMFVVAAKADKIIHEENEGNVYHYRVSTFSEKGIPWARRVPFDTPKTMENLYLPAKTESRLRSRLDLFMNNRDWYDKNGLPHTFTVLLHGPPGTGKTSMIKALAKHTGRHPFSVDLATVRSQEQLENLFCGDDVYMGGKLRRVSPEDRMFVIEEIDQMGSIVRKRAAPPSSSSDSDDEDDTKKNRRKKNRHNDDDDGDDDDGNAASGATLGHLLEVLDGLRTHHSRKRTGRLMVWTTNHIDWLDPALLRAGRVDEIIYLGNVDAETIPRIVRNMCCGNQVVDDAIMADAAACAGGFLTPAEAMSCVQSSFMDPAAACEGLKTKVAEKRKRIEDERIAAEQLAIRRSEKKAKREAEAAAKAEAERLTAETALRIRAEAEAKVAAELAEAAVAKVNPPTSTRRR